MNKRKEALRGLFLVYSGCMSNGAAHITKEELDKRLFRVDSLDQAQRQKVKAVLHKLHDRSGGLLYPESTHRALLTLKNANAISDIDLDGIQEALFGE